MLEAVLGNDHDLLTCDYLLHELSSRVVAKPYLANRISARTLALLVATLSSQGVDVLLPDTPYPSIVRDSDDDFLIALATIGQADVLVTGDRDLLDLDLPLPFRIMSTSDFIAEIGDAE